ncbi:deoxynucleoside kinase [Oceanispirochaeta crateris]|uniref:Deoxynucleoside kinase n=1 Tax=Oceanispirochaeta crateris TaxID=2518645 RepID=A0A5C1QJ89_9SPIO|nr:deoxynucleoside kinase [Oceanispirochaeta crateris]QEN07681.1 deoxynucleoside kinase [Oceanispirochaeta crateris]
MKQYIAIAGNIGAGKSTLVEKICDELSWTPYYEPVTENPYLKDFYKDMNKWAYHSQLFFLSDRMVLHKELQEQSGYVVQDRSIYEDAEIFARDLFRQNLISKRDFETYWRIYTIAVSLLQPPDLLVYLKASVPALEKRISLRGREYESSIPKAYLDQLNHLYNEWINNYSHSPQLILNVDDYDILNNGKDLSLVIKKIKDQLQGGQKELFN